MSRHKWRHSEADFPIQKMLWGFVLCWFGCFVFKLRNAVPFIPNKLIRPLETILHSEQIAEFLLCAWVGSCKQSLKYPVCFLAVKRHLSLKEKNQNKVK